MRFAPLARTTLGALALFGASGCLSHGAASLAAVDRVDDGTLRTIAFGSCAREDKDQEIWDAIVATEPDLFLFIGDNVYVDIPEIPTGRAEFDAAYADLGAQPGWLALKASCPVLATWDDHDFGKNDAGAEWALKDVAQQEFLDFFEVSASSPRRARRGVYHSAVFGPYGRRVQVILLDTRYHRSPLTRSASKPEGAGPYVPSERQNATMLGDEQWAWLEDQLQLPADLRIIASSIQVVASEHGWEAWGNLPAERERLYDLIDRADANGVVFISGDRHLIEISRDEDGPYPLYDFTSSGFNWGEDFVEEPNRFRLGPVLRVPNFGTISIDWDPEAPTVTLTGHGLDGGVLMREVIALSALTESTP
ncbi:MAG: alkaline phosphatase D family protein [Planctomycetota bacterium]